MRSRFRQSRFRGGRAGMAEDVNPSAYIVNLADCMLVLACGFMVSMITFWNIDVGQVQELDDSNMEEVDPAVVPDDLESEGSSYVEAGVVYMDPATGQLYMVKEGEATPSAEGEASPTPESDEGQTASEGTGSSQGSGSSGSGSSSGDAVSARAAGAD